MRGLEFGREWGSVWEDLETGKEKKMSYFTIKNIRNK